MRQIECEHVTDDGSVCGIQCKEAAEWSVNNQAEDDDDYEEFTVCSEHLVGMLESGWSYIVRGLK